MKKVTPGVMMTGANTEAALVCQVRNTREGRAQVSQQLNLLVFAVEVFAITVARHDEAFPPIAEYETCVPAERFDPKNGGSLSLFTVRSFEKRNATFNTASAFLRVLLSPARFSTCLSHCPITSYLPDNDIVVTKEAPIAVPERVSQDSKRNPQLSRRPLEWCQRAEHHHKVSKEKVLDPEGGELVARINECNGCLGDEGRQCTDVRLSVLSNIG